MTTHVVQLTPRGRGAIASLLVEGPGAAAAVAVCFRPHARLDVLDLPLGRIVSGCWRLPTTGGTAGHGMSTAAMLGEEVVVCRTSQQRIEVHCHGGQAAVAAIVGDLQQQGCVLQDSWPDAVSDRDAGPVQLEALAAMSRATTERTARILLDQYRGAFRQEISQLAAELAAARYDDAHERLERLIRRAALGRHLVDPWRVVIAGPPNVGKSSLINALVGYQRAVVFDAPGTTRDVVTVGTAIDGWPIELSDTAGLRATTDPLESAGIGRASRQLQQADLILWVEDVTLVTPGAECRRAASPPVPTPGLVVLNQCDRLSPSDRAAWHTSLAERSSPGDPPRLLTSAVTGEGLAELLAAIGRMLVPDAPPAGAAVPFCESQFALLSDLTSCLARSDWQTAVDLLAEWIA